MRRTADTDSPPDPDACWAWPDGFLHDGPPLPVAYVPRWEGEEPLTTEGLVVLADGSMFWPPWQAIEAPPCGEILEIPVGNTVDGQRRIFTCLAPASHEGEHRAILDLDQGDGFQWVTGP